MTADRDLLRESSLLITNQARPQTSFGGRDLVCEQAIQHLEAAVAPFFLPQQHCQARYCE